MTNTITLMGRLVRDPELRYTGSNVPVASFSVAVDRDFGRGENGEKQTCDILKMSRSHISNADDSESYLVHNISPVNVIKYVRLIMISD